MKWECSLQECYGDWRLYFHKCLEGLNVASLSIYPFQIWTSRQLVHAARNLRSNQIWLSALEQATCTVIHFGLTWHFSLYLSLSCSSAQNSSLSWRAQHQSDKVPRTLAAGLDDELHPHFLQRTCLDPECVFVVGSTLRLTRMSFSTGWAQGAPDLI